MPFIVMNDQSRTAINPDHVDFFYAVPRKAEPWGVDAYEFSLSMTRNVVNLVYPSKEEAMKDIEMLLKLK